jgi:4'-phosphopantetheinyl transferase
MGFALIKNIKSLDHKLAEVPVLENDEVHIYRVCLADERTRIQEFQALLSPEEQSRADRYARKQDRDRFVISKGSLRVILSKYTGIAPLGLQFDTGMRKKPVVRNNQPVFFNVSHSSDWALIAISTKEVGVDIEWINPNFNFTGIVQEYFSSAEAKHLAVHNSALAFFELWTRKEAFLKATGQGIGEYLTFTPSLTGIHPLDQQLYGNDRDWNISSFMFNDDYICAVASELDRVFLMEHLF